jgi:hypothetical protein
MWYICRQVGLFRASKKTGEDVMPFVSNKTIEDSFSDVAGQNEQETMDQIGDSGIVAKQETPLPKVPPQDKFSHVYIETHINNSEDLERIRHYV